MQFLSRGRYIGNVIDGKVTFYRQRIAETGLNRRIVLEAMSTWFFVWLDLRNVSCWR